MTRTCDACGESEGRGEVLPGLILWSSVDGEYHREGAACEECRLDHPRLWEPLHDTLTVEALDAMVDGTDASVEAWA